MISSVAGYRLVETNTECGGVPLGGDGWAWSMMSSVAGYRLVETNTECGGVPLG